MLVYLASPRTQQQAERLSGMPCLLSYSCWSPWIDRYQASFSRILIDSGAFSEMTTGKKVDGLLYKDWSTRWQGHADAVAGLDDIKGDWKRSLRNYELYGGFPTIHDSDPPELLKDLIPIARNRGGWLGIGLVPPRHGKEMFIHSVCDAVPDDIHIHGWALRAYAHIRRLDSVDSTNWWRDGMTINKMLPWLHYGECLDIVIKRYLREKRNVSDTDQSSLFED